MASFQVTRTAPTSWAFTALMRSSKDCRSPCRDVKQPLAVSLNRTCQPRMHLIYNDILGQGWVICGFGSCRARIDVQNFMCTGGFTRAILGRESCRAPASDPCNSESWLNKPGGHFHPENVQAARLQRCVPQVPKLPNFALQPPVSLIMATWWRCGVGA
eukprot:scaffold182401_cov17-Tisochrysis_lutea.AAC.1